MIIFNHLFHKHLIDYSNELHSFGVRVGCLLSEGLCQTESGRKYLSIRQQPNLHCDLFLAWNEKHRDELIREAFCAPSQNAICVGVPRFDLYKEPFTKIYKKPESRDAKIKILVNTTFAIAHFNNRSAEEKLLVKGGLGEETENGRNYERLIKSHYRSRELLPEYLNKIVSDPGIELTIRPHPREEIDFYENWIESLDPVLSRKVEISRNPSVASDILNHDLVINCEDCTTALESWIAGKPTITLALSQDPAFFTETWRNSSPVIESPDSLVAGIETTLKNPEQPEFKSVRDKILSDLVYRADGRSSFRAAEAIHDLLASKNEPPRIPFKFNIIRRAIKLRLLNLLDQPSNATPKLILMDILKIKSPNKKDMREIAYHKAVRPSDVSRARELIKFGFQTE